MIDKPEVVRAYELDCECLRNLLIDFCQVQELPYELLESVPDKVKAGRFGDLAVEEVSQVADALEHRSWLGHNYPRDGLDKMTGYFAFLRDAMLCCEIRENHKRLCEVAASGEATTTSARKGYKVVPEGE